MRESVIHAMLSLCLMEGAARASAPAAGALARWEPQ
jgi:hypothetical protein